MEPTVNMKELIFRFLYTAALRDATLRRAYDGPNRADLPGNTDAKKIVRAYIDALLRGETPDFYATANELCQAFNQGEEGPFHFGNAQKLLNMTAKYVYIAAYQDSLRADLREKFRPCHCPMDTVMVEKVIEEVIEKIKDRTGEREIRELLKGHERNWRGFLRQSWSQMSVDADGACAQYELFQKLVKHLCKTGDLIPMEYDYKNWHPADPDEA